MKQHIQMLISLGYDKKKIIKSFKENGNLFEEKEINKIEVFHWENENVASRTGLDISFNKEKIDSITDPGIQKILIKHLNHHNDNPELAFSAEGIDEMNRNILDLNSGKLHQPILKVRTCETKGNKFAVGQTGNKKLKYVEAAKGTNLFFAIYVDEKRKRSFETIPLNLVVERQKVGLSPVPELNKNEHRLLFHLCPNDLVYLPTEEEAEIGIPINLNQLNKEKVSRIYKAVSFTTSQCFFIKHEVAVPIINKVEFSALNKMEKSIEGKMIKESCVKLKVDRLGNISLA